MIVGADGCRMVFFIPGGRRFNYQTREMDKYNLLAVGMREIQAFTSNNWSPGLLAYFQVRRDVYSLRRGPDPSLAPPSFCRLPIGARFIIVCILSTLIAVL